jgi:hypothetical protein
MYACCSYGKQYGELLETSKHLGIRWYAMVKFCETRFAQSDLKIYANFEKNYVANRRTWGGVKTEEPDESMDNTEVPTTTTAVEQETPQIEEPQRQAEEAEEEG